MSSNENESVKRTHSDSPQQNQPTKKYLIC